MKALFIVPSLIVATGFVGVPARADGPVKEHVMQLKSCKSLRCDAAAALVKLGKGLWPDIQVGLKAPDEMTRFWTLGVLSEVPLLVARDSIGALVGDPKIRVRAAAAYALGAIKDPRVSPWLLKALADKDLNVRFAAAVAMGRVKDPKTVPALTAATRDRDEEVRAYACLALGDIGQAQSTKVLMERLDQDAHPKVRGFAAMSLSKFRTHPGRDVLLGRLKEETDAKALAAAIFALGELGDRSVLVALRQLAATVAKHPIKGIAESSDVADYLQDAIHKLTAQAFPKLRIALSLPQGWTATESEKALTLSHAGKPSGRVTWSGPAGKSLDGAKSLVTFGSFDGTRTERVEGGSRELTYRVRTPRGILTLQFHVAADTPHATFDATVRSLQLK